MKHPEEEVILDDDKDIYDYVIDEEEVDFTGVRISSRESRHAEII